MFLTIYNTCLQTIFSYIQCYGPRLTLELLMEQFYTSTNLMYSTWKESQDFYTDVDMAYCKFPI